MQWWMSQVRLVVPKVVRLFLTLLLGAGNAFLGGLSAGLYLSSGNVHEGKVTGVTISHARTLTVHSAMLYATVSAGYTIQQLGLPRVEYKGPERVELWNGDRPEDRLTLLRRRCADSK